MSVFDFSGLDLEELKRRGFVPVFQIHDEIVFEGPAAEQVISLEKGKDYWEVQPGELPGLPAPEKEN